ncbi:MAG: prepilin peptidase [Burkholderiales bacterium]|nr:prepilin peptidase [Phycisphaerae bacterium]
MDPIQFTLAVFIFLIGACVGSFLNVVVYRVPLGKSLVKPPSACPKCGHRLAAYDNIPVLGWLLLRGKCRYCHAGISVRYPIVELATALLFLGYYLMLFHWGWGPYEVHLSGDAAGFSQHRIRTLEINRDWPVLVLHLWLIGALLAASLIDLEHYIIPLEICWLTAIVGLLFHAFLIKPGQLGALTVNPTIGAAAVGAGLGVLLSLLLLRLGIFRRSFEDDAPLLEVETRALAEADRPQPWPPARIRAEIRREVLFLLPAVSLGCLFAAMVSRFASIGSTWTGIATEPHVSGALGALFGTLVGGAVVWLFRIGGSYGFGREAMGLGDVHLMLGIGACIGATGAAVAFFIAPVFGLAIAIIQLVLNGRRELPYGPYLSLATLVVMLFCTPIQQYLGPGMEGLMWAVQTLFQTGI